MQSGRLVLNRTPTDVGEIVHNVTVQFQEMADSKAIKLVINMPNKTKEMLLDKN